MGVTAAQDYIYRRLKELESVILSERGARQKEAKEERDFLQRELAKVLDQARGKGHGSVEVDPRLADAIRKGSGRRAAGDTQEERRTVFPLPSPGAPPPGGTDPGGGGPTRKERRPPYWPSCKEMDFRELREFVDDSLHGPQVPNDRDRPRSKDQFLDLLELVAHRGGVDWTRAKGKPVWESEADRRKRRELAASRDLVLEALKKATRDAPRATLAAGGTTKRMRKLQQELAALEKKIARLGGPVSDRLVARRRIVARMFGDIERVFAQGGPGAGSSVDGPVGRAGGRRLPWRVMPPGDLTLQRVLAHYEKLARERPGQHFVPERIEKAFSLDPNAWWEGSDGFGGYVVFEYPSTDRVLLECGVYGNAIYVLGPNWKELSRRSKQEVKEAPSSRRILHKGEWFATLKAELGLR